MLVAVPAPRQNVSPRAAPALTTSPMERAASAAIDSVIQACATRTSRRRSTMSAVAPTRGLSTTAGRLVAVWTSAIRTAESDSDATTVTAPTLCIQFTSCDPSKAAQTERNPSPRRSDQPAGGRAGGLVASVWVIRGWVGAARRLRWRRLQSCA